MNLKFITLLLFFFASPPLDHAAEKPPLRWLKFDEAVAEGQSSGKKVLIDVYTDWCGWCKKMDKVTYSDEGVMGYLKENYVLARLNAEANDKLIFRGQSYTCAQLSGAFGITGYPSTIFLTSDGEAITVFPGFADATSFRQIIEFLGEDHYKTMTFEEFLAGRNK